jgi:hypothetical protein
MGYDGDYLFLTHVTPFHPRTEIGAVFDIVNLSIIEYCHNNPLESAGYLFCFIFFL